MECRHIKKIYANGGARTAALSDVSLSIKRGEFVAVMGPSGSGKSTLMHIIGALMRPTSGRYLFDGREVTTLNSADLARMRREKIGFVFQSFHLLPRASVLRNVMLPFLYSTLEESVRIARAEEALRTVALPKDVWAHTPNEISGGQMQKAAIARAIVSNPKLLIADEPTGNLDSRSGKIVLDALALLNKKNKMTLIIITHDGAVARRAQRIITIKDGALV